jgi:hypothetical protein
MPDACIPKLWWAKQNWAGKRRGNILIESFKVIQALDERQSNKPKKPSRISLIKYRAKYPNYNLRKSANSSERHCCRHNTIPANYKLRADEIINSPTDTYKCRPQLRKLMLYRPSPESLY